MPTESSNFIEFECLWCNSSFTRYVAPSSLCQFRKFCSRSCQAKHAKNSHLPVDSRSGVRTLTCYFCNEEFTKHVKASQVPKFCSRSCVSKHLAASGKNAASPFLKMKLSPDVVEAIRRTRSSSTRSRNIGKRLSEKTKHKISASCKGSQNSLKGKTYVQFYGIERAAELSQKHARKLKESYASGKIHPTARTSSAPCFRGIKLRSLLEKEAIEFLERRDGLKLCKNLIYEDITTRVQWQDASGELHTYTPDLHDLKNSVIYEVKPAWKVAKPTDEMTKKAQAVISSGKKFLYLTDVDVRSAIGESK